MPINKIQSLKWLKRFFYTCLVFLFLIVTAFLVGVKILQQKGITFKSWSYQFPLKLTISDFEIKQSYFYLGIKNADLDLSLKELCKGKFKGDNFFVDGLEIKTLPDTSSILSDTINEKPFSYSVVPFIDFRNVSIRHVKMNFCSLKDTSYINIPSLKAVNFTFNDSIAADSVWQNGGDYFFPSDTVSDGELSEFGIPYSVPKYRVKYFETKLTQFTFKTNDSKTQLSKVNLVTKGYNTISGMNYDLCSLNFTIKDTLEVDLFSNKLLVVNGKGGAVHNLKLNGLGFKLDIEEIKLKEKQFQQEYQIKVNQSFVSPSLLQAFIPGVTVFKKNCKQFVFSGEASYASDTLDVDKLNIYFGEKSSVVLHGYLYKPQELNYMDVAIEPLKLSEKDLHECLNFEIPDYIKGIELSSQLHVYGNKDNLHLSGNSEINHTRVILSADLAKAKNKHYILKSQISSEYLNLETLLPSFNQKTKAYHLKLSSTVDLNTIKNLNNLNFHVTSDSIISNGTKLSNTDIAGSINNGVTTLAVASIEQGWKIQLNTQNNILNFNEINFIGFAYMKSIDFSNTSKQTGTVFTPIQGKFSFVKDDLKLKLVLDSLTFKTSDNNKRYSMSLISDFEKIKNNYSLKINNHESEFLNLKFNESIFKWIDQPNKRKSDLPSFYCKSYISLDSNFVYDFCGINGGITIEKFELNSNKGELNGNINASQIRYSDYLLENLSSDIFYNNSLKEANLYVTKFSNPYATMDSIVHQIKFATEDSVKFSFNTKFKEINQSIAFFGEFNFDSLSYNIRLDPNKYQVIGQQIWYGANNEGININQNDYGITGNIELSSGSQNLIFSSGKSQMKLVLDSINIGPIVHVFTNDLPINATLNLNTNYKKSSGDVRFEGNINDILIDTLSFGKITYDGQFGKEGYQFDIKSLNPSGIIKLEVAQKNKETAFDLDIEELKLSVVDSIFNTLGLEYSVAGVIKGNAKGVIGDKTEIEGNLSFDHVMFEAKEYGLVTNIDQQKIQFLKNQVKFNDFKITDQSNEDLTVNGYISLEENNSINLNIVTKKFDLINNPNKRANLNGKLSIESDLKVSGNFKKLNIDGYLNTLNGAKINYFYKGGVTLSDNEKIIQFVEFNKEIDLKVKSKNSKSKSMSINWNVDSKIGTTDLYVLLSKTKQEYAKLNAFGNLLLRSSKGNILPDIYGAIQSDNGKIYYKPPLVSEIQLEIVSAKVDWRGEIDNPVLSFYGKEVFRVTPNEMSSELQNKKDKVPVIVNAIIDEKTLKDFAIKFDISSENSDVQNMLNALPSDTKENYALNMLVFGKVNSDADKSKSMMGEVVNKLNEISRRNIKNADLVFRVDNNSTDPNSTHNSLGYNYTKGFFNQKLRFSVDGNLDVGGSSSQGSSAAKNNPLANVELKYILKQEPELFLKFSHSNTYHGPIEGQVDETSFGVGYSITFKNLFFKNMLKSTFKK